MRQLAFSVLLILAPAAALGPVGCSEKTTTVEQTEEIHESEPQMVSPGEEVVEP